MNAQASRVTVTGQVQGVGFRAFVADRARRAGVAGWACNRDDGTVHAHLEGEPSAVELVIEACRTGPAGAAVQDVSVRAAPTEGATDFATG